MFAKRFLIHRAARSPLPAEPADRPSGVEEGDKLFGTECSECPGFAGRKPTDAGRWMYPRAADLGSPEVQRYSDRELFWIVKNGIRLSGMPAFGRVESDEHIWNFGALRQNIAIERRASLMHVRNEARGS